MGQRPGNTSEGQSKKRLANHELGLGSIEAMNKLKGFIPACIWFVLIWAMSSVPAKEMPSVNIIGIDKLAHVGVYAILGVLVNHGLRQFKLHWSQLVLIYALLVLLASADEFHQTYIAGRSVSVYDQAANILGLLLGLMIRRQRS